MQNLKRISYIVSAFALVAVAVIGTTTYSRYASAISTLTCTDTNTSMDVTVEAPVPMGNTISCTSSTTNSHATHYEATVTDGNGATVSDSGVQTGTTATVPNFTVNNQGVWHVTVKYFSDAGSVVDQELINLEVSFFVLPESPIGLAAIMGSSLAALGAFVALRRRKV